MECSRHEHGRLLFVYMATVSTNKQEISDKNFCTTIPVVFVSTLDFHHFAQTACEGALLNVVILAHL